MLDDALSISGRQTKWKYAIILFMLAMAALGAAWALEHWPEGRYFGRTLSLEGVWKESGCGRETTALALEDRLYLADDDTVTVLDENSNAVYSLEGESGLRLSGESIALAYVPGGNSVHIFGRETSRTLSVPGGVDALAAGETCFALITAGSGYLTQTDIYDYEGRLLGRIGLKSSAMVRCAFTGSYLAALCYGTDGLWSLNFYDSDGTACLHVSLEAEICYDLCPVGEQIAVFTADELLFFDEAGLCTGNYLLGSGEILAWDTGEKGYLALALRSQGKYQLKTFSQGGALLGEAELPLEIRALEVSGSSVCLLDMEGLRVYDAFCHFMSVSGEGARAVSISATEKGLWLLGNGEMMYLNS